MWLSFCLAVVIGLLSSVQGGYYGNYHCEWGRDVMVHLFEWKWTDVARECEQFLAQTGYCAVQVSPPSEHRVITGYENYPWYQRYQPVSYILNSRSGDAHQFADMVQRCNNVGVRIYVDVVLNHMTGGGSGHGSAGSYYDGDSENYPGVPYSYLDFHHADVCPSPDLEVHNYQDPQEVRFCRAIGLRDLRTGSSYVRDRLADYLNHLVALGVAGFRVDAAKHVLPDDLINVFNRLQDLNTHWFPPATKPFVYQEVIDMGGEPIKAEHYTHIGRVTEFRYSSQIGDVFRKNHGQRLAYLSTFGEHWGFLHGLDAIAFLDNHDNQRGHGAGGWNVLTFWDAHLYKMAAAFELAWEYGYVRIMSSYYWPRYIENGKDINHWVGPPSDEHGNTKDVDCFNEWVCEHRWRQIANMVKFHNVAVGQPVMNWWDNGFQAIAFGRGNKAFIVINNEDFTISNSFKTGLPEGEYCDVITCERNRPTGTGSDVDRCGQTPDGCRGVIHVNNQGYANIQVENNDNPMVAIHV